MGHLSVRLRGCSDCRLGNVGVGKRQGSATAMAEAVFRVEPV